MQKELIIHEQLQLGHEISHRKIPKTQLKINQKVLEATVNMLQWNDRGLESKAKTDLAECLQKHELTYLTAGYWLNMKHE